MDAAYAQQLFPELSNVVPLTPGGQKEVFSAVHVTDGDVVLKIYHPGADRERIAREVDAPKRVNSKRVPQLLATGIKSVPSGEYVWVREQRVPGDGLNVILRPGPLTAKAVLRLARDVMGVLAASEAVRIVHRDVKPGNIIVDTTGNAWLIDFGVARHLDLASRTPDMAPMGVGTLGYAPPEQMRNRKREIDGRADLFALGVTLYECIEGINPFRHGARSPGEILHRVETTQLPKLSKPVDSANQFSDFVQALARSRLNHRPKSVKDAMDWLQSICVAEGIHS